MSLDSHLLAMRTMFDPEAAGEMSARFQLRLGEETFRAEVHGGRLNLVRGAVDEPDATISTDPSTLIALIFYGRPLADALRSGDLEIEGDEPAVDRFLGLFTTPEPAAPAVEA
jgi:alkyl sulfatase BDS1-like metallo-beta-lactamase superfamily hydrolase